MSSTSASEAKEAELRAKIRMGKLDAVGRVVLFSDVPHKDDKGKYWKVVPVDQITNLSGTHVRAYRAATKDERTKRIELTYKSGGMWVSRIFARVASGKRE